MKKVAYESVAHLIPEECWYKQEDNTGDVIFFDGGQQWVNPLDLDDDDVSLHILLAQWRCLI